MPQCPAAPLGTGCLVSPSLGLTALMQLWGISVCLCDTVLFLCFRALCWLPEGVLLFSVVFGFWICVRILTVLDVLEAGHKQKDNTQVEKSTGASLALIFQISASVVLLAY